LERQVIIADVSLFVNIFVAWESTALSVGDEFLSCAV